MSEGTDAKIRASDGDIEKAPSELASATPSTGSREGGIVHKLQENLLKWGVETRGIRPVPLEERVDEQYSKIFTLWFSVNFNVLSFSAGVLGPVVFELSVRDSCLVILFINILSCIPPAFFSIWGPKCGLRQMIQARYSFGYYGVILPVIFNLIGMVGFCILNCILGGQALSSVADGKLTWTAGIVIVAIISLLVSFCGYRVLHWYERFAWIPVLIAFLVALGTGGKHLKNPVPVPAGTAPLVLSFAAVIAGFTITYAPLSSDFTCYLRPDGPSKRIFIWAFLGLFLPITCLQLLGAAVGGCLGNVPAWQEGYDAASVGGLLEAMLSPAKGFGKFLTVLISFSVMGNIAATFYSVSLNCQIILPVLVAVPRYVFSVVVTAIVIPVAIVGAHRFVETLSNFLGLLGYWASAFIAICLEEHYIFRKNDWANYDLTAWNRPSKLTTGLPGFFALGCAWAIAIPCMDQVWYIGPIAKSTGDIGFEMAFVMALVVYPPLRFLETKLRGL